MKNYVQEGDTLTLTAPYARNAGDGALIGAIFGVACNDVANGSSGEFAIEGVFDITALSTDTGAAGVKMYWDDANKRLTTTPTGNTLVGALTKAKANGEITARVRLDGTAR